MEERDILKDQIQQLGKVLANIVSAFLDLKLTGNVIAGIEVSNQRFQDELDLDIEKILALDENELKGYLQSRKLSAEHLEILSEYLKELGATHSDTNKTEAKSCFEKAIELLDISDEISKTLSFVRENKKAEIQKSLDQIL